MIYSLEVIWVMHSNLIKVNEDLAFAKNKEGIISLINKKHDDYSFEDIEQKESEIAMLEEDIKKINLEYQRGFNDPQKLRSTFLKQLFSAILMVIPNITLMSIAFSQELILTSFLLGIPLAIAIYLEFRMIRACFASYAKMRKYAKQSDDTKKILAQIKELLNIKKVELEKMLDKVDYREYTKKEEIASILNNMLNVTPSNVQDNTLTSNISNVQSLSGPSLIRKKD